jgi:hypothetical protein
VQIEPLLGLVLVVLALEMLMAFEMLMLAVSQVLVLVLVLGQQEGVHTVGLKPSRVPVQHTAGLG